MSELPPEIAVEPEPTDADPPPEAIRPERPRIWPEEPRAPRPQIKRSMEEWLAEFDERVKQVDARPREQPSRRRRPRGLARIVLAEAAEAANEQARVGSRNRSRVRRVLSARRREGRAGTPHTDLPPQRAREKCAEAIPHAGRLPQGLREICPGVRPGEREMSRSDGDGGVGGVDAARDRTVRRLVVARRVPARRPADTPGHPNSPE